MTVDIDRIVEITENYLDADFCTSTLEKFAFSYENISKASSKLLEAASKNAVAGLSEQSVFIDQYKNKTEFAYAIGYEIFEAFLELTINFIFYQFVSLISGANCTSSFCISASTFQLFKALKIAFKFSKVIKVAVSGHYKKSIKLFLKYSSKELGKSFGKSVIPIPMIGNIFGSFLGGIGQRIFM
ncbi:hypothetical protein ABPG72_010015 [Tetrahymena utriculariae]